MNKRVNFEDNIFILTMRIRLIRDTITLDADSELFIEKTLDDIYFTDQTLRTLSGYIEDNPRLIEREEILEYIAEIERQFSQVIHDLLNHQGSLSVRQVPEIAEKLAILKSASLERRKNCEKLIPAESVTNTSQVVSSDELSELLKAF